MRRIVILGLGPAGSAAAIASTAAGADVVLLGREPIGPRVGETLPPQAGPVLHNLAFPDPATLGHLHSPGVCAAWEYSTVVDNDFLFNPLGCGWHLDRAAFDRQLLTLAETSGVRVVRDARPRQFHRSRDAWALQVDGDAGNRTYEADFIVDATGRSSWFAARQGADRQSEDRLVGVVWFFSDVGYEDQRTHLEAAEDGWWYGARIPNGGSVVAFMTDADLANGYPGGPNALWRERLAQSSLVRQLTGAEPVARRIVSANSTRLAKFVGDGWLAVGDAAAAWDPLSSQGILCALEGGRRGGLAAAGYEDSSAGEYADWMEAIWSDYQTNYRIYYGLVRRWPDSPFWRRRQSTPSPEQSV